MSTSSTAFEKRERAAEEVFFRQEERLSMLRRLEKMVAQGRLDASVLEELRKATSPDPHHAQGVQVSPGVFKDVPGEVKQREDLVYAHAPGTLPLPRPSETERMRLGTHADMGPSRWNPGGGASIFSLRDSLAGEEAGAAARALPEHEAARLARIQARASGAEVPTVFGYRLAPGTPGRTFFWGSVLAIWGTAALIAASARGLGGGPGEGTVSQPPSSPSAMGQRLAAFFLPWRTSVQTRRASRAEVEAEEGAFVRALKQRMVEGRA